MSRCKYCGEHVGFLSKYHKKCQQVKSDAWQKLLNEIETTIVNGSNLGTLRSKIVSIGKSSFIDSSEINYLLAMGFSNAVGRFLEDGVLSRQEEESATLISLTRLDISITLSTKKDS